MNETTLPPQATKQSRIRYDLAQFLVEQASPSFGQECVLTGSVSRGVADDYSDIEMVFYVDRLPLSQDREEWLQHIDATKVVRHKETSDSVWVTFSTHRVWVETGWQTFATQEKALDELLTGTVTDHGELTLAWVIAHAVPLRSTRHLARWKQKLTRYPESLPAHIIADSGRFWTLEHVFEERWVLLQRGDAMSLAERLLGDVQFLLRILFAVNHQWEPEWKWLQAEVEHLTIKPERLAERINAIFASPQNEETIAQYLLLLRDVLRLASLYLDVGSWLRNVEESLRKHRFMG